MKRLSICPYHGFVMVYKCLQQWNNISIEGSGLRYYATTECLYQRPFTSLNLNNHKAHSKACSSDVHLLLTCNHATAFRDRCGIQMTVGLKLNDAHSSPKERHLQKICVSFGEECSSGEDSLYQHFKVIHDKLRIPDGHESNSSPSNPKSYTLSIAPQRHGELARF